MTRKHFQAFAEGLRERRPAEHWDPNKRVQWEHDREVVMIVCARFNPNFKADKFIEWTEK